MSRAKRHFRKLKEQATVNNEDLSLSELVDQSPKRLATNSEVLLLTQFLFVVVEFLKEHPDLRAEIDRRYREEYGDD